MSPPTTQSRPFLRSATRTIHRPLPLTFKLPPLFLSIFFIFIAILALVLCISLYVTYPANAKCRIAKSELLDVQCHGKRWQCGENGTLLHEDPGPGVQCTVNGDLQPFKELSTYPCYSGYWEVLHRVEIPVPAEVESRIRFRTREGHNTTESRTERDKLMKETYQTGQTHDCYQRDAQVDAEEGIVNPFQRGDAPGELVWGRRERRKTWAAIVILFLTACLMGFLAAVTICLLRDNETGTQRELKRRLLVRDDEQDADHDDLMMELHGTQPYDLMMHEEPEDEDSRALSDAGSGFETEEEVDQMSVEVGDGFRRMQ